MKIHTTLLRTSITLCLVLVLGQSVFAQHGRTVERYRTVAAEYSVLDLEYNIFGPTSETITSVGLGLSGLRFWNDGDFGLHSGIGFRLPQERTFVSSNGVTTTSDYNDHDMAFMVDMFVGLGFRNRISDATTVYIAGDVYGLGFGQATSTFDGSSTVERTLVEAFGGYQAELGLFHALRGPRVLRLSVAATYLPSYSYTFEERNSTGTFTTTGDYVTPEFEGFNYRISVGIGNYFRY